LYSIFVGKFSGHIRSSALRCIIVAPRHPMPKGQPAFKPHHLHTHLQPAFNPRRGWMGDWHAMVSRHLYSTMKTLLQGRAARPWPKTLPSA
jgi:hypothetical protein